MSIFRIAPIIPPENLAPEVEDALAKLTMEDSTKGLTLEEIFRCYHYRPVRRVTPGTNHRFSKYQRGSVLVYANEVVLILNPDDNICYAPCERSWCIGPRKAYKGLLPGSRLYTKGGNLLVIAQSFRQVTAIREVMRSLANGFLGKSVGGTFDSMDNRCHEAWGLLGRLDAQRFMMANLAMGS